MLLLAVTAFAIGFPIWYRWPYEEDDPRVTRKGVRWITTWQRQWGGGRLKHGPERILNNGKRTSLYTYRNGVKHGPYDSQPAPGGFPELGAYANDMKDGVWTRIDPWGKVCQQATWRNDLLDGPLDVGLEDGSNLRLEFTAGQVTAIGGRPTEDRLRSLIAADVIDSPQVVAALRSKKDRWFSAGMPLKDVARFLAEDHAIGIVLDAHHANSEASFSGHLDVAGMHLSSALAFVTSVTGHACDYRYGCLWITSPEDAKDWHDPTGVAEIEPQKGSQLAMSWNEPAAIEAIQMPLADAVRKLAKPLAIPVDVSAVEPANDGTGKHAVTQTLRGHQFRHALAVLLYQSRCRCELRGNTLVILPQEAKAP